jgi:hypothetical protein
MDTLPEDVSRDLEWHNLPQGVPLDDLLTETPDNALKVRFSLDGPSGASTVSLVFNKVPLVLDLERDQTLKLVSRDNGGQIQMTGIDGKAREIPKNFFQALAKNPGRLKIAVLGGQDVAKVIAHIEEVSSSDKAFGRVTGHLANYPMNNVVDIIQTLNIDLGKNVQIGGNHPDVVFREVGLIVVEKYMHRFYETHQLGDLEEITRESIESYLLGVNRLLKSRPQELKDATSDPNSLAISFDEVGGDSNGIRGQTVLTVYRPDRGWTLIAPTGACPSLASSYLEGYLSGTLPDDKRHAAFAESMKRLEDDGVVKFDREKKVVVFKDVSRLDPGKAVFHGEGYTAIQAFETLSIAGDPFQGERYFHDILYKENLTEF